MGRQTHLGSVVTLTIEKCLEWLPSVVSHVHSDILADTALLRVTWPSSTVHSVVIKFLSKQKRGIIQFSRTWDYNPGQNFWDTWIFFT